jgi:hypothetical protein
MQTLPDCLSANVDGHISGHMVLPSPARSSSDRLGSVSTLPLQLLRHAIELGSQQSHRIGVECPRIRGGERGRRIELRLAAGHEPSRRRILRYAGFLTAGKAGP